MLFKSISYIAERFKQGPIYNDGQHISSACICKHKQKAKPFQKQSKQLQHLILHY